MKTAPRGSTSRPVACRWVCLGALLAACASRSADDDRDWMDPASDASEGPPLVGVVAQISLPARTTPDRLSLVLLSNLDRLTVRASLEDARGVAVSACQRLEIYRIGPAAQSWPLGGTLSVPLGYDEVLSPGDYRQTVRIGVDGGPFPGTREQFVTQYFEVGSAGLAPIVRGAAAIGRASAAILEPIDPPSACPVVGPYSDVWTGENATTRIDLDSWVDVGTIQPLRWQEPTLLPDGARSRAHIAYHVRDDRNAAIRVDIVAPTEDPEQSFEVELGAGAQITVEEGIPVRRTWSAVSGHVNVTHAGNELRLDLTDVRLHKPEQLSDPERTKVLAAASIVGSWIRE